MRYLSANPGDVHRLVAIPSHASLNMVMICTTPKTSELASRIERAEMG